MQFERLLGQNPCLDSSNTNLLSSKPSVKVTPTLCLKLYNNAFIFSQITPFCIILSNAYSCFNGISIIRIPDSNFSFSHSCDTQISIKIGSCAFWRSVSNKCNHSIFRHDNFIGCSSADKIKMPARKYFCFNIPVYKNMVEESSCRSPYHEEYIQTSASGNPEGLCH